ncbi:MAG: hypothetical protein KF696_15570 [Planctomycetes bacterium]|nr:hypothetical protein [Planctomycetota bacterium]MCW8136645.1 hypothetical protein [Planctomycetota bacterium]
MIKRTAKALLLLSVLTGAVLADVDPARTPFAWKVSGDSLATFKAEFVAHHKPDRSTPRALVETYAAFTDNRYAMGAEFERVNRLWLAAVNKSLEIEQAHLFDEPAHEVLKAANAKRAEPAAGAEAERISPLEVTDQSEGPAGTVYVEAMQNFEFEYRHPEGDLRKRERREHWRFTCARGGDEKWLIRRIEIWKLDLRKSTRETPVYVWEELETLLDFFYFTRADVAESRKTEIPAIDTGTAENAALSVFKSLAPTRQRRMDMVLDKGLEGWIKAVESLFTEAAQAAAEAKAARKVADARKGAPPVPRVDHVEDGADGVKIIHVTTSRSSPGLAPWGVTLHLRQVEGNWRITACGWYELKKDDKGKLQRTMGDEHDIYVLAARLGV